MTRDRVLRRHHDSPDSDLRVAVVGRAMFLGTMTGLASGAAGGCAAEVGAGELYGAGLVAGIVGAAVGVVVGALLAPAMLRLAWRRAHPAERPAAAALGVAVAAGMWLAVSGGAWVLHAGTVVAMVVAGAVTWWALPWVLRPVRGDYRAYPGTES